MTTAADPQAPNAAVATDPANTDAEFEKAFAEFADAKTDAPPADAGHAEEVADDATPDPGAAGDDTAKLKTDAPADDKPPQTQATKPTPSGAAKADPKAAAPQDDIWTDAKPEHRDAFKAARDEQTKADRLLKAEQGRTSALQRKVNELTRSLEAKGAQSAADKSKAAQPEDTAPIEDDDFKTFREEYPEVAGPIEKRLKQLEDRNSKLEKELGGMSTERRLANLDYQETSLAAKHPDWESVCDSDDFGTWLQSQPNYVKQAAVRNGERVVDAEEAAHIIGLFKHERAAATQPPAKDGADPGPEPAAGAPAGTDKTKLDAMRDRRLETGKSIPSKGPGKGSGPPDDFEQAFDYFAKKRR